MHHWIDRVGLFLQFVSLWLVAPELLGELKMRTFGIRLATFLTSTMFVLLSFGVVLLAWTLAFREGLHWFHRLGIAFMASMIVLVPKFIFFRKLHNNWVPKLVQHLSSDESFRHALGIVGATLFTLGFLLQFIATF